MSLLFLFAVVYTHYYNRKLDLYLKENGIKVDGIVVGIELQGENNSSYPVIRFVTENKKVICEIYQRVNRAYPRYVKGEKVEVYYDRDEPKVFVVSKCRSNKM